MESLEVIARPHFEKADLAWLTDIRSRRADSRGPPYFTLVFPGADMTPAAFAAQIRKNAEGIHRIRFHLRSALVAPENRNVCQLDQGDGRSDSCSTNGSSSRSCASATRSSRARASSRLR